LLTESKKPLVLAASLGYKGSFTVKAALGNIISSKKSIKFVEI
jgi:hypothetical protein